MAHRGVSDSEVVIINERIDRSSLTVTSFEEADADDIDYWTAKTPAHSRTHMMSDPSPQPAQFNPQSLRVDYGKGQLLESNAAGDPVEQFGRWLADAQAANVPEPNAMVLATVDPDGAPAARVMLLKEFDARGFTFFTNYESRKGRALAANPRAALCFFWHALERQVRVEGTVERVSRAESDAYFHSRPLGAQVGAWTSRQQSGAIASRDELERRERELFERFKGKEIPLPDFWGGYRVVPRAVEFWQGRPSRLHDRLLYTRDAPAAAWKISRLSP
jgi:pyridoxamine 5'-phosphate oxidase